MITKMARALLNNNVNPKVKKCVNTVLRSLLEKWKINEPNDTEFDYLKLPKLIVHANSLKHKKPFCIFKDGILVGSDFEGDSLIKEFAKEYAPSKVMEFEDGGIFVMNVAKLKEKDLIYYLECHTKSVIPKDLELFNPNAIEKLKAIFKMKKIALPEKVTVNELLKKLSTTYVYKNCDIPSKYSLPEIMKPFTIRLTNPPAHEFAMWGEHLGSDYYYSNYADSIEKHLKANEEYDENAERYLSFVRSAKPERIWTKGIKFDFGKFAKVIDSGEEYSDVYKPPYNYKRILE